MHTAVCAYKCLPDGNNDFMPCQHEVLTADGSTEMVLQNVLMGSY